MKRVVAIGLAVATFAASAALSADDNPPWEVYARPQQLVRLPDGRRLNLICMGQGSPVVILESGGGNSAWAWSSVHYKIAATTRTCTYDRAGLGFSDEGPLPRDALAVVADLQAMLKASGMKGPYVLVGHSVGSYYVRLFADLHPKEVAGMVLVDPSADEQDKRMEAVSPGFADRKAFAAAYLKCAAEAQAGGLKPGAEAYKTCVPLPPSGLPPDVVAAYFAYYQSPAMYREAASEQENFQRGSDELVSARRPYGDMPLIVLTGADTTKDPPSPEAIVQARAKVWRQMHDEMAALSSRGQHRVVDGSGHYIQFQQPQVVIDAVNEVVADARRRAAAADH